MSAPSHIVHGNNELTITPLGEAVTAPYAYSTGYFVELTTDNELKLLVPAKEGFRFIINSFWISGSKTVDPNNPATVTIYETYAHDYTQNLKTHIKIDVPRGVTIPSPANINMRTESTRALVAVTDDETVTVTLVGYYVPELYND